MTIAPVEVNASSVVQGAVVTGTSEASAVSAVAGGVPAASPMDLAEPLGPEAIAVLASARVQAAEGGARLLGSDGLLQSIRSGSSRRRWRANSRSIWPPGRASPAAAVWRNGRRCKKIATEVGPVQVMVPRDRAGTFEPRVVRESSRRTSGIDEIVISLMGKGLTTGEVSAHLKEVFGIEASKETVSAITDRVLEGMADWRARPLDPIYPVLIIDAVHVKIRVQSLIL